MPSSASASFSVHKFHLVSCSAFLETVVSFRIFLTLDYFVNLSLAAAFPLPPSIFIAPEYQAGPLGPQTIYHAAVDFDPPWPFSLLLDLIQFPHVLLVCRTWPSLLINAVQSQHPPLGYCVMQQPCILVIQTTQLHASATVRQKASQMLQCNSSGPSRRKYLHFYTYYCSYQILHLKKRLLGGKITVMICQTK